MKPIDSQGWSVWSRRYWKHATINPLQATPSRSLSSHQQTQQGLPLCFSLSRPMIATLKGDDCLTITLLPADDRVQIDYIDGERRLGAGADQPL